MVITSTIKYGNNICQYIYIWAKICQNDQKKILPKCGIKNQKPQFRLNIIIQHIMA